MSTRNHSHDASAPPGPESLDHLTHALAAAETALAGLREAIETYSAWQAEAGNGEDAGLLVAALAARKERGMPLPGSVVKHIIFEGAHPVRAVRDWRNLTQSALASAAGTSEAYVRQIENRQASPGVKMLKKLAAVLDVDWTTLVDDGRKPIDLGY